MTPINPDSLAKALFATAREMPVPTLAAPERKDGLDEAEGEIMDMLCDVFNAYAKLPVQHPDDLRDVADAVHRVQDLLAVRVCRRYFPEGWPIKQ